MCGTVLQNKMPLFPLLLLFLNEFIKYLYYFNNWLESQ
ncbi:hypothetical protein NT07LI_0359 [Listeria innocua FSL S4-378]|nr:hypothetical protein NT07LI_0359 [Listeria innocua FSL S4-378]